MTVSTTVNKAFFDGSGSTGPFTFNFRFFTNSDIYVVKTVNGADTTLAETTDYTLTGANSYSGGAVTLTTALAVGEKLTIYRTLSIKQLTDLRNQGAFFAETHEDVFDRLTMVDQQQKESIERAIKVPVSTPTGVSTELPPPSARMVLGWDGTGSSLQNYDAVSLGTAVAYGSAKAEVFTGDGSTADFVLELDPASVNNLDVSIGGISQVPGNDYTLSYKTVIFTTAPPDGETILIRYMQALPTGTIDWPNVVEKPFIDQWVYITTNTTASALGYTEINVLKGGSFVISSGVTFTIDVPFSCGLFQCFSGAGSVVFGAGAVSEVYPEWWGAVVGDNTKGAINKTAINTALMTQTPVVLSAGTYYMDAGQTLWGNNFIMRGAGMYKTIVELTTAVASDAFYLGEDATNHSLGLLHFYDFALKGNSTVGNAFRLGANPAGGNGYCIMPTFERLRVHNFTNTGLSAFHCLYTWWVNIKKCLIEANYNGFTFPNGAVTTTFIVEDNTEIKNCVANAFYILNNALIHDLTVRNVSVEYAANTVLTSTTDKARIMFDKVYLEQNTTASGSAQFEVATTTTGRTNATYLSFNECTSDAPLSGKTINVGNVYLHIEDSASFVSGTIVTTANTYSRFIRMNGITSADFIATAKTLLGNVYAEEFIPAEGRRVIYQSEGNIFMPHVGVRGTAPTIAVSANAGTGGSAALMPGSTDSAGRIEITYGSASWVAGIQATITFNKTYNYAPIVILTPASTKSATQAAVNGLSISASPTTGGFSVSLGSAETSSGLAYYNYMVIETAAA